MADFFGYLLHSPSTRKYYIGQTENLDERLELHSSHLFKNSFTKSAEDWSVVHSIKCVNRKQAVNIETHIKKNKSRTYIENLIRYPDISRKLLEKYPG